LPIAYIASETKNKMPKITLSPTLSDFRILEASLLGTGLYLAMLGDFFEEEHYRFWAFVCSVGIGGAYFILKTFKDMHSQKILKNDK